MKVGDVVQYELEGDESFCLILGEMSYSKGGVFLISDGITTGMPTNVCFLTKTGEQDLAAAWRLRRAYLDRYPGTLKPEANQESPLR